MLRAFFLLILSVQLFAIVAVKPREVGENPGISGEAAGAFETKRGNSETDNYSASFQLQYDNNISYLVWGMVRAAYGEAYGVKNTNNLYLHLRYIENLDGPWLAKEYFTQIEEDEFKSIRDRWLIGGDLRVKALRQKDGWGGLFVGAGAFAEYIGYTTGVDPAERNLRFSFYLAYLLNFADNGSFGLGGYYQPKVDNANDYYVTVSGMLEIPVYRQLYLRVVAEFTRDTEPAEGVKKEDFSQQTYILYKF